MEETVDKLELLSKAELSIWLDTYDDVFSDFDSRPLSERALSDDFLNEVRKMVREKPTGHVQLKLLIPSAVRDTKTEAIVTKNLHSHFKHYSQALETEMQASKKRGYLFIVIGFALMIGASFLSSLEQKKFYINALQIITEPAGWFIVWTGFDTIFYNSKTKKANLDFASRMCNSEITFLSF